MILTAKSWLFSKRMKYFLVKVCEQIISEIGELLPSKFRFIVWGRPLSLVQESTYSIRKCAIEISEKSDYPDNVSVYRVYLRAMKSEVLPETVPVSTCTITSAPSHVQVVNSTSHIGAKAIDRLVENLNEEKKSLEYRLQIAQATVSSLKEAPKERPTIGRNPSFTCIVTSKVTEWLHAISLPVRAFSSAETRFSTKNTKRS